jgi:hypothetical protein
MLVSVRAHTLTPVSRTTLFAGSFGSSPLESLLREVNPRLWISGHKHCFFTGHTAPNGADPAEGVAFVALDRPDQGRRSVELIEFHGRRLRGSGAQCCDLQLDEEWLAILAGTFNRQCFTDTSRPRVMEDQEVSRMKYALRRLEQVRARVAAAGPKAKASGHESFLCCPSSLFHVSAPVHGREVQGERVDVQDPGTVFQTGRILDLLELSFEDAPPSLRHLQWKPPAL